MGEFNLTVVQGANLEASFAWTQNGVRQSFNGWTVAAQIRTKPGGELLLDLKPYLSVINNVTIDDGTTGQAIHLDVPADTARLVAKGGKWDLFLNKGADGVRLLYGTVTLEKAVTDDDD